MRHLSLALVLSTRKAERRAFEGTTEELENQMTRTTIRNLSIFGAILLSSSVAMAWEPRGYARSDGISAVVYASYDQHIHELSLLREGWHHEDLTAQAGAPLADGWANAAPYVRSDHVNSVVYKGDDSHIYELFSARGGWQFQDLTALGAAPLSDSDLKRLLY